MDIKNDTSAYENISPSGMTHKSIKGKSAAATAVVLITAAVIIALAAAVIILAVKLNNTSKPVKHEYLYSDFIPAVNNRVYDFYNEGDSIILEDGYFGQIRLHAYSNVPKPTYNYDNLVFENNRYQYYENGVPVSKTGIDVSYHQENIDWEAVAADGIEFAILRVGYRGYESGQLNLDERFENYIEGAQAAGIDAGVYFYSQAVSVEEAIEEAEFVLKSIDDYRITYPVIFDWELPEDENARTRDMHPDTLTECAAAFCDTVADAGYIPMVYAGKRQALLKMDMSRLAGYDFWYPQYKDGFDIPEFNYDFQIWQYASDGKVNGINGGVDMNICFVDYTTTPRGRY